MGGTGFLSMSTLLLALYLALCANVCLCKKAGKRKWVERCPWAQDGKYTRAGRELYESGKVAEALECLKVAVEKEENAVTLTNLASLQTSIGKYDGAEKTIRKALKHAPTSEMVLRAQTKNLYFQKKYPECIEVAKKWVVHHPRSSEPYLLIGSSHYEMKQSLEALQYYEQALQLEPEHAGALVNTAVILNGLGRSAEAVRFAEKAAKINPSLAEAHINHAAALISTAQYGAAEESLERALQLKPEDQQSRCKLINIRRLTCNWSSYEEDILELRSILERQLASPSPYISGERQLCHTPGNLLHFPLSMEMHREVSRITSERDAVAVAEMRRSVQAKLGRKLGAYRKAEKMRVGFVSFDYKNHPATHILLHLFSNIDPMASSVEVFAYALNSYQDFWTKQVKSAVRRFHDVSSLTLQELTNQILSDEIHILVDLMGFSTGGRPALFALKPAPIQVAYMGYPGTTGSPFIDYIICDATACKPITAEKQFSEKLILLSEPYFAAPMAPTNMPSTSLEEFQMKNKLPKEKFIFCCMSQLGKLDKPMFQAWLEILNQTVDSFLWLLRRPPEAEENILREAKEFGYSIDKRIIFTEKLPREEFLHFAPKVCSLFLDTHLYNAHTVAAEILQGGLPLLTLPGDTMASRVASSLVRSLGLERDLTAESYSDYIHKAVNLFENPGKLASLQEAILKQKAELKESPLFNPASFARNFVSGLQQAWQRFQKRQKPQHIYVSGRTVTEPRHTEL